MKKLIVLMATMLTFASTAFAQIGTIDKDLVFTPVTPCRLFDTRPSQGGTGAIAAAGVKNLLVWGQSSYAAQGGAASNCGLLAAGSNVAAVAVNLTVITPAAGGYITAYPFGTALPTAATVNFVGGDIVRGNFTVAKVNQGAGLFHLTIYSSSLADVVGDVVGFYSKPVSTALQCVETGNSGTYILPGNVGSFNATCSAGYSITGGGCSTSNNDFRLITSRQYVDTQSQFCTWKNEGAVTSGGLAWATCCRVPGR